MLALDVNCRPNCSDSTCDNDIHKTKFFLFIADWRHGTEMQTLVKGDWWMRQRQRTAWNCHLHPSLRFSGSSNHYDPSIFGTHLTGEFVSFKIIALGYATASQNSSHQLSNDF